MKQKPKQPKNKTGAEGIRWDLSDFYKGSNDPQIEKDWQKLFKKAKKFEQNFRGKIKDEKLSANLLNRALKEYEFVNEDIGKILSFARCLFSANTDFGNFFQAQQERETKIRDCLRFFELEWMALSDKASQRLITHPKISKYRHYLEVERTWRTHCLPEGEERILDEKANTGIRAWARLFTEVFSRLELEMPAAKKIKKVSLEEALGNLYSINQEERKNSSEEISKGLRQNEQLFTYIYNIILQEREIEDRLRQFNEPMAFRHLSNEIEPKIVEILLQTCEDNIEIVQKYYHLKAKLLNFPLKDYDRYAPIFSSGKRVIFKEAKEIIIKAFNNFCPSYSEVAQLFFGHHWIDAEMRLKKESGACAFGMIPSKHPLISMSYQGTVRNVLTLAHELGHGLHHYYASQKGLLGGYYTPLIVSEMASTFSEMLIFKTLLEKERNPRLKLALLSAKIEELFATIFRQVIMTRFEQKAHRVRRDSGGLKTEILNNLWLEENRRMFGKSVEFTSNYGWWWGYVSHFIHSPFYCYAYSFGELLVLALYELYLEQGEKFVPRYLNFLKAGGSDWPEALLKRCFDIDIQDSNFWQKGLNLIRSLVEEAEILASKI